VKSTQTLPKVVDPDLYRKSESRIQIQKNIFECGLYKVQFRIQHFEGFKCKNEMSVDPELS
jgi:hypothetical protein